MPGSRMRPITFSERGYVISPENSVWISYPPSTRVTIYNAAKKKIVLKRVLPFATFKQLVPLLAPEIFAEEAMPEFTLMYKHRTLSGPTVLSTIDLDQTFGSFQMELDLQAVQVNLHGDRKWFMSIMGYLQEREQFQVTPAASSVQMLQPDAIDSAVFTMSNQMSLLFSMMSLPEDIFDQSPTQGEIINLSYTDTDRRNMVQQPLDTTAVKVTLFTQEGGVLLTDLVMGEVTFEDVAKMHCLKICQRLGHTEFAFTATSCFGTEFLPTDLMVGGFGIDVNVIAVRAGDADRWLWKVCNTGYLEKRTYYW